MNRSDRWRVAKWKVLGGRPVTTNVRRLTALAFALRPDMHAPTKIVTLVALAAACFLGYSWFSRAQPSYELLVVFPHANGLVLGSPVTHDGNQVGNITELSPWSDGGVAVQLHMDPATKIKHPNIPLIVYETDSSSRGAHIAFVTANDEQLASIFGPDLTIAGTPYQDGEFVDYGLVPAAQSSSNR